MDWSVYYNNSNNHIQQCKILYKPYAEHVVYHVYCSTNLPPDDDLWSPTNNLVTRVNDIYSRDVIATHALKFGKCVNAFRACSKIVRWYAEESDYLIPIYACRSFSAEIYYYYAVHYTVYSTIFQEIIFFFVTIKHAKMFLATCYIIYTWNRFKIDHIILLYSDYSAS